MHHGPITNDCINGLISSTMIANDKVHEEFKDFLSGLFHASFYQDEQYLKVLLRWNHRLTDIRNEKSK